MPLAVLPEPLAPLDPALRPSDAGFGAADLAFLSGLSANNDRDWFAAHRAAYDEGLKPTLAALMSAASEASTFPSIERDVVPASRRTATVAVEPSA